MTNQFRFPAMEPLRGHAIPDQFWAAVAAGEFRLPKCVNCGDWRWYPLPLCPVCGAADLSWDLAPTQGTVFSFTTVHHSFLPLQGKVELPYCVGLVELDDARGFRFVTNLAYPEGFLPRIGDHVELMFADVDAHSLPVFGPIT